MTMADGEGGLAWPLQVDSTTGMLAWAGHDASVRHAVVALLGTVPGERLGNPEYGCRLGEVLHRPATAHTASLALRHVRQALARWEPRVSVEEATVVTSPHGALSVEVVVRVLRSGGVEAVRLGRTA